MTRELDRRLRRLEQGDPCGNQPTLIFVRGGPAALDPLHAEIGQGLHRLDARVGETEAELADRALDFAELVGAGFVVINRPDG